MEKYHDEREDEKERQVLIDTQTKGFIAMPPADIQERTFKVVGPSGEFKVYTVRPVGTEGEMLPGVVYFHGGWVLGDFTTHERLMRDLATQANAAMVFVEYTLVPARSRLFNNNDKMSK